MRFIFNSLASVGMACNIVRIRYQAPKSSCGDKFIDRA